MAVQVQEQKQPSIWDTPLTMLIQVNWEIVILVGILLIAAFTRFYDLGSAAWSHDESIHTNWAFDLYKGRGYVHNPVYHGPLLYHLTALAFFILGDSNFSARTVPVLFGLILIATPYLFREWLGKRGWVVTSIMLFISPVIAAYSRVDRHDIYIEVFVVLMALAIMKYLKTRGTNWLYFSVAVLALAFTAMETTFIFMALFGYFLASVYTYDRFQKAAPHLKGWNAATASLFGLPFAIIGVVRYFAEKFGIRRILPEQNASTIINLIVPILNGLLVILVIIFGHLSLGTTVGAIIGLVAGGSILFALGHFGFEDLRTEEQTLTEFGNTPAFDLLLVLGTFIVPMGVTPLFIKYALLQDPTDYSSIASISAGGISLAAFVIISALVGLAWNWRKWLICAAWFYPIMLIFFTTVFTNPAGIASGFVGSLGYWISQQGVARGSQPQYYYFMVTLPQYEYLPYLFGLIGLFYILARRSWRRAAIFGGVLLALIAVEAYIWFTPGVLEWLATHIPLVGGAAAAGGGAIDNPGAAPIDDLHAGNTTVLLLGIVLPLFFGLSYDPEDAGTRFPTLLGVWTLGVMVLFSWAGEKMPWLTMHFAIPLSFVAGYFMDDVLNADWRDLVRRGAGIMAGVFTLGLLVFAFQFFFGPAPLSGTPLDAQARQASTIISILLVGASAGIVVYLGMSLGLKNALRVLAVTVFAILAVFTVRTMVMAAYIDKDMATETIVYAQGTPDVPYAMAEIDELSRRLCSQNATDNKIKINCDNGTIKVAYDDDSSWPFVWYLRNYKNAQFYGKTPAAPFDAEVVIVGDANENAVKSFLGNRYVKRNMRLVWWPDEGYKGLDWGKLFGSTDDKGAHVTGVLEPDNFKKLIRDIWFYHDPGISLSQWSYVHRFSMYVRKDVANQLWQYAGVVPPAAVAQNDPYLDKFVEGVQAEAAINGTEQPLNAPKNMAFAPNGSLYVLDTQNHRVQEFDAQHNFVKTWGSQGADPGQFNEPWGIAVAKDGTVFVADTWNHRIEKFDKDGNFIKQWGTFGDVGTSFDQNLTQFYGPRALAIGPNGNLWVSDTGNERMIEFSPDGSPITSFGGTGGDVGQFLEPVGLTIDDKGNFYVADTWNQRIQIFDKDMNPVRQIPVQAWESQSVVNKPYIAVDKAGNIYVTDPEGYRVIKYSNDGNVLAVWGGEGNDMSGMELPTGILVDAQNNIYVADAGNNRILEFAPVSK